MLLIILQLNIHFQLNNHPIRPPNAASGDLRNYNCFLQFRFCSILIKFQDWQSYRRLSTKVTQEACDIDIWPTISKSVTHTCITLKDDYDLFLLTRQRPFNLLPEPTSTKHEYGRKLWGHPVTSSMTSSPWKILCWHNLGRSSHIRGQIAAVFNISKFLN